MVKKGKDEYTLSVLKNYERAISLEDQSSKYLEGKDKSNTKSRFNLRREARIKHSDSSDELFCQKMTTRETMDSLVALLKGEEDVDAPGNAILGLSNEEREDEDGIEDIVGWRKLTLSSAVDIQNSAKSFLPRVSVPKTKFKGLHAPQRLIKIPTGGKFGSNTMLFKPAYEGEDMKIDLKPPSYLEASLLNATRHTGRVERDARTSMDHRKKTASEKIGDVQDRIKDSEENLLLEVDILEHEQKRLYKGGLGVRTEDCGSVQFENRHIHDQFSNHHRGTRQTSVIYEGPKIHSGLS